jgi:hypothetical protein
MTVHEYKYSAQERTTIIDRQYSTDKKTDNPTNPVFTEHASAVLYIIKPMNESKLSIISTLRIPHTCLRKSWVAWKTQSLMELRCRV